MSAKANAEKVVGPIEWQSDNHGLCRCPGEHLHSSHTRVRDTTVFIDGVPTIFCWHTSCQMIRDDMNYKLRKILLNDPLMRPLPSMRTIGTDASKLIIQKDFDTELNERIAILAESNKVKYLNEYNWDPADMYEESPQALGDDTNDYHCLLSLFQPHDNIWIGAVKDSGNHPQNFRSQSEWAGLAEPVGQFTTGAVFKAGTISRSNDNVELRRYLVVESDVLTKPQMGAVFRVMREKFKMKLYAIVDTGGKSLHAWFENPPCEKYEKQLKSFIIPLGCDPATFKPSQPIRMPGAKREDKTQSLLWFCKEGK